MNILPRVQGIVYELPHHRRTEMFDGSAHSGLAIRKETLHAMRVAPVLSTERILLKPLETASHQREVVGVHQLELNMEPMVVHFAIHDQLVR
jgi:hypothetical protein